MKPKPIKHTYLELAEIHEVLLRYMDHIEVMLMLVELSRTYTAASHSSFKDAVEQLLVHIVQKREKTRNTRKLKDT